MMHNTNKNKPSAASFILIYSIKLVCIYFLLLIPWPFLTGLYVDGLKSFAGIFIDRSEKSISLTYERLNNPAHPYSSRITIVNPSLMNPDGSGPVRELDFDSRGIIWNPCALLLSLLVTSPISWKSRLRAIGIGLPLMLLAIYFFVRFLIWHESSAISLVSLSPFMHGIAPITRQVLLMDISLVLPAGIWIITAFSPQIRAMFLSPRLKK